MVHHYGSQKVYTLELDGKSVKFQGQEFVTDSDETAQKIEANPLFACGRIWKIEGVIAQEKSGKHKVVSGPRGTN